MRSRIGLILLLGLLIPACSSNEDPLSPSQKIQFQEDLEREAYREDRPVEIRVLTDLDQFTADGDSIFVIDFEDLPRDGSSCPWREDSIPNPLTVSGVVFTNPEPHCLKSWYCGDCELGERVLFMRTPGTIEYPVGTRATMLAIEGMGDGFVNFTVESGSGGTLGTEMLTVANEVLYVGFLSDAGITRITYRGQRTSGGLVLSSVWVKAPAQPVADLHEDRGRSSDPVSYMELILTNDPESSSTKDWGTVRFSV